MINLRTKIERLNGQINVKLTRWIGVRYRNVHHNTLQLFVELVNIFDCQICITMKKINHCCQRKVFPLRPFCLFWHFYFFAFFYFHHRRFHQTSLL